ncbi:MotA/TolQ/ExbB proton channel family protein (plasmid) [Leisingera aquaemixtae]|jgi:biopolymer transport protein ExbB|uniref:MotA/TolQ/ExbB proton channel family protein n=1 Tax=Leisingera TaxID=191028 RepID=UPI00114ED646|nr:MULTISPECIES: MotA/TolQ/ExbB proton channel family protein [Leisingera]QDI78301.1 MotA/TolQ/ExbB proton channel family protein [Leisingera aquaemixtae]UWQ39515.1 MotA/TolQ/ExbB proton channel family protein [Leisingera aquaemixtae]
MSGTWDMLGTGGPVIALLALMSLLSVTVIAVKLIQLWPVRSGAAAREQALDLWRDGDRTRAQQSIGTDPSPAGRVMGYAMQALQDGLRGPLLQDELQRRGNEEVSRMNSLIRLLELIAMVAPLLGLLGTVLGMIQSFQELELAQGAANASVLAGGIWQALLTTAAGLMVAIPAAVAAGLFAARIDAAAQAIESAAGRLLLIDGSR